ncbi:MAG: AMP-binding protein [Paracoccaceae bacterium]
MISQPLVTPGNDWSAMRAGFAWPRPAWFNLAEALCDRWARAEPERRALTYLRPDGEVRHYNYIQLSRASSRFANALAAHGLKRGDRVALLLPQTPEAILTHLAAYRLGAVVVPLFTLFGADGLQFRLADSGARMLVTDGANLPKVLGIRDRLPALEAVFSIDTREGGAHGFWQELGKAADICPLADTTPDDPAFISYTSGTTGPPKGALHGHRVLLGHLPGVETHHNFLPQKGDCMWTPADWAWMGGLTNVMMPALYHGVPLIAHRMAKFDPEAAFALMADMGVRNTFLPPTALKLMRSVANPPKLNLRSVGSGGEALGAGLADWGRSALGTTINEFYGQTECNLVLGNSHTVFAPRSASTGRAVPGSDVAILNAAGEVLSAGQSGEIAVKRGALQMFLGYWNQPEKTAAKYSGEWMRTGDEGHMDSEGYFFFESRADDVITSSGYRIGPSEIEDCLTAHPDVEMAAVVGVPDPVRTEVVKAYVVARRGAGDELAAALIARVRLRISPHVAPKTVEFVESLPMTATGKIMRRELKARG